MVTPVINSPSVSQVSQHGRLMAAGARGVSTVDRSNQVEATSQHYSYDPDNDGILFNAYIDGKEGQHRHPGQGNPGDQKDQRAEQSRLSQARRASDREGAISSESDVDFASLLDPEIPFDLGVNSGTSFYAVVNAVVHGANVRGTRLDAYI